MKLYSISRFIILICFLQPALLLSAQSSNSVEKARYFLSVQEMPDVTTYLPPAPSVKDPIFINDSCVYAAGKKIRQTSRGHVAVADTSITLRYIMKRFGEAMQCDLTPENYPILSDLIFRTYTTARLCITKAKDIYHRQRPYQYFGEPTPVPNQEHADDWTSYPSGHTIRYWTTALLLASIDVEHQNDIYKTGYELGQSRTIVGFHYQSDIDAARLAAGTAFARLVGVRQWQKSYKKAVREFKNKRKGK